MISKVRGTFLLLSGALALALLTPGAAQAHGCGRRHYGYDDRGYYDRGYSSYGYHRGWGGYERSAYDDPGYSDGYERRVERVYYVSNASPVRHYRRRYRTRRCGCVRRHHRRMVRHCYYTYR
jgi:hypothetical protein